MFVISLGNEDEKTKVILKKPAGLTEAKDGEEIPVTVGLGETMTTHTARVQWTAVKNWKGGEKDGMYEWICAVQAGKNLRLKAVKAEWDVQREASTGAAC